MLFHNYVLIYKKMKPCTILSLSSNPSERKKRRRGTKHYNRGVHRGGVKEVRSPGGQIKNWFDENVCIIISIPSPCTIIQMIRLSYSRYLTPFNYSRDRLWLALMKIFCHQGCTQDFSKVGATLCTKLREDWIWVIWIFPLPLGVIYPHPPHGGGVKSHRGGGGKSSHTKTLSVCKFFVKTRVCLLSIGYENCDILYSPPPHVAGHPTHRNVEYIHINSINLLIPVTYISPPPSSPIDNLKIYSTYSWAQIELCRKHD